MTNTHPGSWRDAWRWYAIPAAILLLLLVLDLTGVLDVLQP